MRFIERVSTICMWMNGIVNSAKEKPVERVYQQAPSGTHAFFQPYVGLKISEVGDVLEISEDNACRCVEVVYDAKTPEGDRHFMQCHLLGDDRMQFGYAFIWWGNSPYKVEGVFFETGLQWAKDRLDLHLTNQSTTNEIPTP